MPSNTAYNPQNVNEFEKVKLFKDARGIQGTAAAGQSTNFDLTLTDDVLMAGGAIFLAKGAAQGDKVDFQVLAGGQVVAPFITNWFLNPDATKQEVPQSMYPAKIFAGMTLRVIYHSVGQNSVWVAINYNLEKVLV